jgi:hypothetical protein
MLTYTQTAFNVHFRVEDVGHLDEVAQQKEILYTMECGDVRYMIDR